MVCGGLFDFTWWEKCEMPERFPGEPSNQLEFLLGHR